MSNKKPFYKRLKALAPWFVPVEKMYYEAKPLAFALIALWVIQPIQHQGLYVKYAAVMILAFSAYVGYARLHHRGYLKTKR